MNFNYWAVLVLKQGDSCTFIYIPHTAILSINKEIDNQRMQLPSKQKVEVCVILVHYPPLRAKYHAQTGIDY